MIEIFHRRNWGYKSFGKWDSLEDFYLEMIDCGLTRSKIKRQIREGKIKVVTCT